MIIPFDPIKVAQAAAFLVGLEPSRRMSRLRLLKLLYIADRDLLQERGRPVTGDHPVAMDNGPVLSSTYNLIKGEDYSSPLWNRHFRNEGRDIHLISDPGVGKLSRMELQKLRAIATHFAQWDDWAVAEFTHGYAEWIKNKPAKNSMKRIPLEDLLEAVGLSGFKDEFIANEKAEAAMERLLG